MKMIDSCLDQVSAETLASIQGSIHLAVVPTALVSGELLAVGKILIETTGGTISIRLEFIAVSLCGIQQDCTRLVMSREDEAHVDSKRQERTLLHFGGEAIEDLFIIETKLTRSRPELPDETFIDHTGVLLTFRSGCLAITKFDQVTPSLEILTGRQFADLDMPDPRLGWPSDLFDSWVGEFRLVPLP